MPIGYVYMISSSTGNYVGSTIHKVNDRLCRHKNENHFVSSQIVLNGENVELKVLEEVEYIDKQDTLLKQEEQKWIDMMNCVNVERAFTPDDWKKIWKNERNKNYREDNHQLIRDIERKYEEKQKISKTICNLCGKEMLKKCFNRHNKTFHTQFHNN